MTETGNITKIKNVQERLKEHESRFECDNEGIEEIDNATIEVIKNDLILLKDVEINKDILKQTKIGVTVNKFTKINNESIKNISKELVDKWKNIAIKEKNTNKDLENIKKRKHNETENSNNNVNEKGPELKKKGTSNSLNNSNSTHINEDKENNGKNSTKSYAYNSNENRKINIVDIEEMQKWNYNGKYHHDALRDKAKQFLFKAFITGSHDNLLHLIDRNKKENSHLNSYDLLLLNGKYTRKLLKDEQKLNTYIQQLHEQNKNNYIVLTWNALLQFFSSTDKITSILRRQLCV